MTNSNLFIIYADDTGTNVTLSPRLGVGEIEPNFNPNAQVSLLEGSGIANGKMTANVRCMCSPDALGPFLSIAVDALTQIRGERFQLRELG